MFKSSRKAFRGLAIGLSISALNFAGLFLTLLLLGGLGNWSGTQFAGIFGIFEIATGLAFILCPNVWRMPVIEAETSERTAIRLTASTLFIPHWAGGAKCLAGLGLVIVAAVEEGAGVATVGILPFAIATAIGMIAASAAVARWGVARPDLDVIQIIVHRPGHDDLTLPGLSLSAAAIQIVLGAFTLPVIKAVSPSAFFQPEIGPSPAVLLWTIAGAAACVIVMFAVWYGRISWQAPREQQLEAEKPA